MATIQQLSKQIEELTAALNAAVSSAERFKAALSGGTQLNENFVAKATVQLERLNASISRMKSERLRLVNERDEAGLKSINKSIETLGERIRTIKSGMGGAISVISPQDVANTEAQIKKLESSLAGFKAYRDQILQGRQYPQFAQEVRTAPPIPEVVTHVPSGATTAPASDTNYKKPMEHPLTGSFRGMVDALHAMDAQFGGVNRDLLPAIKAGARALQRTGKTLSDISLIDRTQEGIAQLNLQGKVKGALMPRNYKLFVDNMGNYADTLDQLQKIRFAKDPRNKQLLEAAKVAGFSPEDLKRARAEGGGAYRVAEFERRNEAGFRQQQSFRVDQGGNVSMAPVRRQFQSFGQSVVRDIVELTKWSLAISAIYGPINALSGAIQELIANQSKLADVTIAVNESVADTDKIFSTVYASAQRAGEGVSGVIDAFGQAYRAAGRITDATQRYQASIKLLDASLLLSKISTLDQAQAIDVLTAALYQTGDSSENAASKFDRAQKVLDQWVRVSKVANVDVATLATGVAVLGDSAEAAGLSLQELNALVGTIAENTSTGSKEAANIAKALVGNYVQPQAVEALNKYGIAVKDLTGKNREFVDVMNDIASLRQSGALGEQGLQDISLAVMGGGVRRAANFTNIVENWSRVGQLVTEQENTQGEAAGALAKQLDTVQTAVTRLGNALTGFVQALGSQGGLLDVFSSAINLASKLVEVLTNLAQALGKTGPIILGLATAAIALKATGTSWGDIVTRKIAPGIAGIGLGGDTARERTQMRRDREGGIYGTLTGQNALGRIGGSILAAGIPAIQNFAQGDKPEAIGNLIGGAIGAVLGGPVGALAGASIAEAFVRATISYDTDFSNFFAGVIKDSTDKGGETGAIEDQRKDLLSEAFKKAGLGSEGLGKVVAQLIKLSSKETLGEKITGRNNLFGGVRAEGEFATPEAALLSVIKSRYPDLYRRIIAASGATGKPLEGVETPLSVAQKKIATPQLTEELTGLQKARQSELTSQLVKGEIKPAEFAKQMQSLSTYTINATRYMAALGAEVTNLNSAFGGSTEAYQGFLDIVSSGNVELLDQINRQVDAIQSLQVVLDTWDKSQATSKFLNPLTGTEQTGSQQEVRDLIKLLQEGLSNTLQASASQVRAEKVQAGLPNFYGSQITPSRAQDVELLMQKTREAQRVKYQELSPADYQALIDSFDKVAILVEEGGKIILKTFEGIDAAVLGEMQKFLEEAGQIQPIGGGEQGTSNFQQIDVTLAQLMQAVQQANAMALSLQQNYGYQPNFEDVIFATNDEQISKQHVDMKILQYILGQILETEKKQLEGMYNIPEGATFWVPLTAAWLAPRKNEGTGGFDMEMLKELLGLQQQKEATTTAPTGTPREKQRYEYITAPKEPTVPTPDRLDEIRDMYGTGTPRVTGTTEDTSTLSLFQQAMLAITQMFGQDNQLGGGDKEQSTFQRAIESLSGIGPAIQSFLNALSATTPGANNRFGSGLGSVSRNPLDQAGVPSASTPTKFNISFASTTQLVVDGRVLASIIKPYLAEDMANTNETGGTITRQYVI